MKKTKIFAAYLPQYHEIEENNIFWGKGFTDWVTVRQAVPLFDGHVQPKVPYNRQYYDLSDVHVIREQAKIAKKYGINGFNIYHYWFEKGQKVLQTPAELILRHKEIDVEFFFTWDNSSWKRSWSNVPGNDWTTTVGMCDNLNVTLAESPYLLKLDYGDMVEWRKHFDYLLPFFMDSRYLKINGCPVFMFFTNIESKVLKKMGECWKTWAKEAGFNGLFLATQKGPFLRNTLFDAEFCYQPNHSGWSKKNAVQNRMKKMLPIKKKKTGPFIYDYEYIWKKILYEANRTAKKKYILGGFVKYDDTPRRGENGTIVKDDADYLFYKYFSSLYHICCKNNHDIVLLTAWNEWGEGSYLEPDMDNGFKYLEAVRACIEKSNYFGG